MDTLPTLTHQQIRYVTPAAYEGKTIRKAA
jgi:hypothetical protein